MLKIGNLELGTIPRIVASLSDIEVRKGAAAAKAMADIFELRVDQFQRHDPEYVARVCRAARVHEVPLIATVRAHNEGGAVALADEQRAAIFEAITPLVDAVDIEFHAAIRDRVLKRAQVASKLAIVSHHDFEGTPRSTDLMAIIDAAKLHRADIAKLAVTARGMDDVERLLTLLLEYRTRRLVLIAMGPYGTASRVFFPLFGSLLTYGFLHRPAAPGQLSLVDLHGALRRYSPDFAAQHPPPRAPRARPQAARRR